MDVNWKYVGSFFMSVLLHGLLIGLLIFGVDTPVRKVIKPAQQVNIVKAVSIDKKLVEKEIVRLKEIEKEKFTKEIKRQEALEKKLRDLNKKTARAEKKRMAEEKKLAELKKKNTSEQKKRKEEQKKVEKLKLEVAEIEKKKEQEEKRKLKEEAERKEREEIERQQEIERKRKEEDERLMQAELAEEKMQQEAAQKSKDQQLLQRIVFSIKRSIISNFNKSGLLKGLECVLSVRLIPGGEVINVSVSKSSGNDIFDRRALNAVQKASPLPIPEDVATFERLRLRQFSFRFRPED
jgi:colicin import membrane protein